MLQFLYDFIALKIKGVIILSINSQNNFNKKVLAKGENLCKIYTLGESDVKALDNANFEIYDGEFLVILGPSGSGKSTLLNIIGGMDSPSSGSFIFDGKDISSANDNQLTNYRRNEVGFVFQFYNLMPNLTAIENVQLSCDISENPLDPVEILGTVGLGCRLNHFPSQMSGGEQQRVALARALSKNPKILLADEPTGALDSKTGSEILSVLSDFNTKFGKTIIIITHNRGISKMADRIFHIKDGKIENVEINENKISAGEVEL